MGAFDDMPAVKESAFSDMPSSAFADMPSESLWDKTKQGVGSALNTLGLAVSQENKAQSEGALAAGETALSTGTGITAAIVAPIAQGLTRFSGLTRPDSGLDTPEYAKQVKEGTADVLTYQPKTELAQKILEKANPVIGIPSILGNILERDSKVSEKFGAGLPLGLDEVMSSLAVSIQRKGTPIRESMEQIGLKGGTIEDLAKTLLEFYGYSKVMKPKEIGKEIYVKTKEAVTPPKGMEGMIPEQGKPYSITPDVPKEPLKITPKEEIKPSTTKVQEVAPVAETKPIIDETIIRPSVESPYPWFREVGKDEVLEPGANIKMDMKTGKNYVEESFQPKQETKVEPIKEPVKPIDETVVEPSKESFTGTKNAIVEQERVARGLEPIEKKKYETDFEATKAKVDSGEIDARKLAKDTAEKPRALTPEENDALLYDRAILKNEHNDLTKQIDEAIKSGDTVKELQLRDKQILNEDLTSINDKANTLAGTESGLSLGARRKEIAEDYSLPEMIVKRKINRGNKPISEAERSQLKVYADRIAEADAKIVAYEKKMAEQAELIASKRAKKSFDKLKSEVAYEQRKIKRAYSKTELAVEYDSLSKEFSSRLGGLHAGIDPTVAPIIIKITKNRIKSGVVTVEGIVDNIYMLAKEAGYELSKREIRDAISGYGLTKHPNKEQVVATLRELKAQMRLISAFEDVTKGKVPLKSGFQRDVQSPQVRELTAKVKQLMKDSEIGVKTEGELWKTRLESAKTRLKNQIDDIEKQMRTGEQKTVKGSIVLDTEALKLRNTRDFLKEQLDLMEGVKDNKTLTDEQRINMATKAVEKSIIEYQRRINEKDLIPKKTGVPTQQTPELIKLKESRDQLKQVYADMVKDAKVKRDIDEVRLDTFKKRISSKITELQDKINRGDFSKKERKELVLDKEAIDLRFKKEQIIREYKKAENKVLLERRDFLTKAKDVGMEVFNASRALMTSMDLSAVLRQGAFIVLGHPIRGAKAIPSMFKALMSEKGQFAIEQEIMHRPTYDLMNKSGLYLSEHGAKLSQMEEAYMSSFAEIPIKIKGVDINPVSASARAYTTYLNRLRADSFDAMVQKLTAKEGKPTPQEAEAIANYVNVATGRGNLGAKENALVGLSTVFFAPRYVMSRFQILLGQPLIKGSLNTKKMIAKEYARFFAGLSVVYALGIAAGGKVEKDPRSSDYGKIQLGKTRIDPMAGMAQTSTFLTRAIQGETKPIGKVPHKMDSREYWDTISRFLRTKLAPIPGAVINLQSGKDVVGNKVEVKDIPTQLLTPLALKDIYNVMIEQGIPKGTILSLLSIFGMGMQNYDKRR